MYDFLNRFSKWLAGSMDNQPGGASSKKLSAFWSLVILVSPIEFTWLIWAYRHDNWTLLPEVLTINLMFAAVALGINAAEKIRKKESDLTGPDSKP